MRNKWGKRPLRYGWASKIRIGARRTARIFKRKKRYG